MLKRIHDIYQQPQEEAVVIKGWVRNNRQSKNIGFLEVNDGSDFRNIQIVYTEQTGDVQDLGHIGVGSSVICEGEIILTPEGKQAFEMQGSSIEVVGAAPESYPLQNKRHSFEFLRTVADLRARTNTFSATFRMRSEISYAVHRFFHERGFIQLHSPIITAADAEGAGEMFNLTHFDLAQVPLTDEGQVNFKKDFFGEAAHLAVSAQLNAEAFALCYKNVYSFGPTFRAEDSNTTRHAAEFWMIEPEIAFADLNDNIQLAEDFIRTMIHDVMHLLPEEMNFFDARIEPGLIDRLTAVHEATFERMTYTEAIDILQKSKKSFEYPVQWGIDLQTEHERFLTDEVIKGPVFVTDYPKDIKAFYMRQNDDQKTVGAVDLLVPGIGEIIGGSQREERRDVLETRMNALGMNLDAYDWYLNLRTYGGTKHAGFGVGFERLLMYLSGMKNIRDVIAFPRVPGQIKF